MNTSTMNYRMTKLRMTNSVDWAHEFNASCASEIITGVRAAWRAWRPRTAEGRASDQIAPDMMLPARLAQIDAWLASREARCGVTHNMLRDWRGQAASWRSRAIAQLAPNHGASPLMIHVLGDQGDWLSMGRNGTAIPTTVGPKLSPSDADVLWRYAELAIWHENELRALTQAILYPKPQLV